MAQVCLSPKRTLLCRHVLFQIMLRKTIHNPCGSRRLSPSVLCRHMPSQPCSSRSSCARPTGRPTLQCGLPASLSPQSSWSTSLSMWLPDSAWKLPQCESSTSSKPRLQVCVVHQLPRHECAATEQNSCTWCLRPNKEASRQASCHQLAALA